MVEGQRLGYTAVYMTYWLLLYVGFYYVICLAAWPTLNLQGQLNLAETSQQTAAAARTGHTQQNRQGGAADSGFINTVWQLGEAAWEAAASGTEHQGTSSWVKGRDKE